MMEDLGGEVHVNSRSQPKISKVEGRSISPISRDKILISGKSYKRRHWLGKIAHESSPQGNKSDQSSFRRTRKSVKAQPCNIRKSNISIWKGHDGADSTYLPYKNYYNFIVLGLQNRIFESLFFSLLYFL